MSLTINISNYCIIRDHKVWVDGQLAFDGTKTIGFAEFVKAAFKSQELQYLKFYKMDSLCKLGFLAAEFLLKNQKLSEKYQPKEIGLVLSNAASCLETDIEHQKTIADAANYFPSPSVFVYTLPNIVIGEISIRHKFQGENTFFIFEKFEAKFLEQYVTNLYSDKKVKACVTGWVEFDPNTEKYEAFLVYTELTDTNLQTFTAENLIKIYNS